LAAPIRSRKKLVDSFGSSLGGTNDRNSVLLKDGRPCKRVLVVIILLLNELVAIVYNLLRTSFTAAVTSAGIQSG
jgi:hypothetical protein